MIEIVIKAQGEKVADHFKTKGCTLIEVASALLRLKQIEQELIDKDFESELEVNDDSP